MQANNIDWDQRVTDLWSALEGYAPDAFVAAVQRLADERPPDDAAGLFEVGSAQDSTGHTALAVPSYRAALAAGLTGSRRRRATIQLASSLRVLGHPQEAVDLLSAEVNAGASDELDAAVLAFLALALADVGREREALAHTLRALSGYLPRYNRSLERYAAKLINFQEGL
nr:tetratricopeptide repeat protein [Rhodoferax sp.]